MNTKIEMHAHSTSNLKQGSILMLALPLLMASGLRAQSTAYGATPAVTPSFQTLYSIAGGLDGLEPSATVTIGAGGVLYGMTYYGGTNNSGTIFSLTPPSSPGGAWTHAVLYDFTGGSDGQNPYGTMAISPTGVLYGTTENGGNGHGVAFSLSPPASPGGAWTETVMHGFVAADGQTPEMGLLLASSGDLYGTTAFGGLYGNGVVFRLVPDSSRGWRSVVLHHFGAPGDGAEPQAAYGGLLISGDGLLYGTTLYGGASGNGTIFSLTPTSSDGGQWNETMLYSFTGGSDGGNPTAGLTAGADGTLYGTTSTGAQGGGTVFSLTPPASTGAAWTLAVLYTVSASGVFPSTLLLNSSSQALCGTTNGGGQAGDGTIFVLTPPAIAGGAWTYTAVYAFSGANGANPIVGLVPGPGGVLYGTTVIGGSANSGTVFRLTL
jgi:uncharacterized repeat protein (TIGR03803 family)